MVLGINNTSHSSVFLIFRQEASICPVKQLLEHTVVLP